MTAVLEQNHPLRRARWIWPEAYMYLHNHYAQFRKDFALEDVPASAPLFITADKAYKLYINGQYVCRGPARGYQSRWPYDEVDVASYLRAGRNWISVEGYNPGISTAQYQHQTMAGFICSARWGGFALVTDKTWLMRRSPGRLTRTARLSLQTDFQEHMDLRLENREWITSGTPPTGWTAEYFPPGSHKVLGAPFGQPPYNTLEPRGIPMLREELIAPVRITCTGQGVDGPDVETRENISWGWIGEARASGKWDDSPSVTASREDGALVFTIPATVDGQWQSLTIDLGGINVGSLVVEVENARGGEILDFQYHQYLRKGKPIHIEPGGACLVAMANRLWCREGACRHEFFHYIGAGHVTVIARKVKQPLKVKLQLRTAVYPFTMKGAFSCSDDVLNAIHSASRKTQQICSLDAYVDTPWREQAQWWGDARVQARNTFYLDGDARLLARGIRQIAGQKAPDGLTYGHAPTSMWWAVLPDFSLTWISTVCDHYYQTGDAALLSEQAERIEEVIRYFDSDGARGVHGLIRHDERFWYFGDWSTLYKGEIPALLNLQYIYTLRQLAAMLGDAGLTLPTIAVAALAEQHIEKVMAHLFDTERNCFLPGLDAEGNPPSDAPALIDQTMAIMAGLVPGKQRSLVENFLVPYLQGRELAGAIPSAFWCTYVLETAAVFGYAREAISFIRRKWGPMMATGTTWEGFDWDEAAGWSCSHAWTAHPAFHFVNMLAGITQTSAGWKSVRYAPAILAGIDHASCTVPTPRGNVTASWQRNGSQVEHAISIPAGMTAKIDLRGAAEEIQGPAEKHFRTSL